MSQASQASQIPKPNTKSEDKLAAKNYNVSHMSRFVKDKEDNNTKFENERENITSETTIELDLLKSSVSQFLYRDVLSIIEKEKNSQVKELYT